MGSGTFKSPHVLPQVFVSIPSRDLWGLARRGEKWIGKNWSSFNPFQGFMGSGTRGVSRFPRPPPGFNPFQGFMGSGTIFSRPVAGSMILFQSLPGIYGVWHRATWGRRGGEASFNPFQGFMGSGTEPLLAWEEALRGVSIPSRDLWGLAPPASRRPIMSGSWFQSLPGIYGVWHLIVVRDTHRVRTVSIPSRDLWGLAPPSFSCIVAALSLFQSLPGIYGVWHGDVFISKASNALFQSLPGIYGVWHVSLSSGPVPRLEFQSLPGIYGVWHHHAGRLL